VTDPADVHCMLCRPGGVSAAAAAWGSKWVQLLDWEESGGRARRSEVWALTGQYRIVVSVIERSSHRTAVNAVTWRRANLNPGHTYALALEPRCRC
jgi:hypothetical protein